MAIRVMDTVMDMATAIIITAMSKTIGTIVSIGMLRSAVAGGVVVGGATVKALAGGGLRAATSGFVAELAIQDCRGVGFGRRPFHANDPVRGTGGAPDRMSIAQRLGVGLFYAAIAALGTLYALFEHHRFEQLAHFIKETLPLFCLVRTVVLVLRELSGVSPAAQAKLHVGYGKK